MKFNDNYKSRTKVQIKFDKPAPITIILPSPLNHCPLRHHPSWPRFVLLLVCFGILVVTYGLKPFVALGIAHVNMACNVLEP